jgi:putative ABC transport system permease protein
MTLLTLVRRNLGHFWQTNLAVIAGVAVAVAVLAGALLVGSSVRASLRDLALERLGATDQVITSAGFVRESMADELAAADGMPAAFGGAVPIIAIEGFVTHQESARRATGIQVYGVDDRFWKFHGQKLGGIDTNTVLVSEGLADELGAQVGQALLVRVEKPSVVPISSLHGRRDDIGRTLRLSVARVLSPEALGEFSFHSQQGRARSVFVSLGRLQRELEQTGRINTILLRMAGTRPADAADSEFRLATAEAAVREVATLEDLGLRVRALPIRGALAVESVAGLLNDQTAAAIEAAAGTQGLLTMPVLTYLANQLRFGERVTPYSLVAALDLRLISGTAVPLTATGLQPIVLNDWTADDLGAQVGDTLTLEYYVWEDEGRLTTHQTELEVAQVVPIEGLANDRNLAPDYPGITGAADVTDWDPPFEIELGLIRSKDEDYWDAYRATPKGFISLDAGQALWASRWGRLTSVRLHAEAGDLQPSRLRFQAALRSAIDPLTTAFVVYPARVLALEASAGATDFGLYFIYFSFFLVVSALLLTSLFFRLGVEQRVREIGLLRAEGFPSGAIRRVFWSEALVLSIVGSAIGVAGAICYAEVIMLGLRTWWVDSVGTTRLSLHVSGLALGGGVGGGIVAAFASIAWTLWSLAPASARSLLTGAFSETTEASVRAGIGLPVGQSRATTLALALAAVGLTLVALASFGWLGVAAGFFGAGLTLLCSILAFAWAWLHTRPRRHTAGPWSVSQVGFRNTTSRPGRSVLCVGLIASATFIIVAVDAFRREGGAAVLDRRSGTGGFALLADTLLPIAYDPASDAGRDVLNLLDLYEDGGVLEGVSLMRFRVRPGEDASCLNLYQAKDPRILAPTDTFIQAGRFSFGATLAETAAEEANPWLLLDREFADGAVPAIADATSLAYTLHLSVGEDFVINRDSGRPIRLRIVAALSDSIFQRELLISEARFERVFPSYDGYRFFLIDAVPDRMDEVAAALENRLADFGFDVLSAGEKLDAFHRVENTYLATFQALGGLGLILGTLGLGVVLLRNVLERRHELALLRAVGYNAGHLSLMVLAENALLLLAGLTTGTVSAVVAIAPAWLERGGAVPLLSIGALLVLVVVTGLTASLAATMAAIRSPLLSDLRTE